MAKLPSTGSLTGVFEKDISREQLAGIGEAAVRFNHVENGLEAALVCAMRLGNDVGWEIVRKFSSIENKITALRLIIADYDRNVLAYGDEKDVIGTIAKETLDAISTYKRYRDSVVHCRLHNGPDGIALKNAKGKPVGVLITAEALEWATKGLTELDSEIANLFGVFAQSYYEPAGGGVGMKLVPNPKRTSCIDGMVKHRQARKALGHAPELPSEE